MRIHPAFAILAFAVVALGVVSCTEGATNNVPVQQVTTTNPGVLGLTGSSATLTSAGATSGFTASESGYTGALTATSANCAGVATFSPASGTGPSAVFTVTAVANGTCQITVKDASGQAAVFNITVAIAGTTPGALGVSTSSVAFTAAGAVQSFSATEAGYSGALTASNGAPSCAGIATFSPASGTGPTAVFNVTAVAAGTCQIKVSDTNGQSTAVTVTVTTTSGTVT
jgi:hypothetical protein